MEEHRSEAALLLRTHAVASGFDGARGSNTLWGTADLSVVLGYRLSQLFELRLETGLWLPITSRPRFVLNEDQTVVSTTSALGVFSNLSIGVRL